MVLSSSRPRAAELQADTCTPKRVAQGTMLLKSLEKRDGERNRRNLKLLYSFKADGQTSHKSKLIRKCHGEGKHDHYWLLPSTTNFRHRFFIFSFFQIRSRCVHRPLPTHCGAEVLVSAWSCFLFLQDQATVPFCGAEDRDLWFVPIKQLPSLLP